VPALRRCGFSSGVGSCRAATRQSEFLGAAPETPFLKHRGRAATIPAPWKSRKAEPRAWRYACSVGYGNMTAAQTLLTDSHVQEMVSRFDYQNAAAQLDVSMRRTSMPRWKQD